MASIARDGGSRPQGQGPNIASSRASDPPPSTLAANLVNNLSNGRKLQVHRGEEDFQRLLHELSEAPDDRDGTDEAEQKLESHHKLIYVVAKAVLAPLCQDNPFANTRQQLQQASEALDILIITIKETPEVLIHVAGSQAQLQSGSNVPLWVWLMPQVLPLFAQPRCVPLLSKIHEFLGVCFHEASKSLGSWGLSNSLFKYLKHCLEGALNQLQGFSPSSNAQQQKLELVLPLVTIEFEVDLPGQPDLRLEGCTYTLDETGGCLRHCISILSLLLELIVNDVFVDDAIPMLQGSLPWVLECIASISGMEAASHSNLWGSTQSSEIEEFVLTSLETMIESLEHLLSSSLRRKVYNFVLHVAPMILSNSFTLPQDKIGIRVQRVVRIVDICGDKSLQISAVVRKQFLPLLLRLLETECDGDVQPVVLNQFIEKFLMKFDFDPLRLGKNSNPQISDADEASTMTATDLPLPKSIIELDKSRSSKRQKVSHKPTTLAAVVDKVYTLLGAQQASDLDGLSAVAGSCYALLDETDRCQALKYLQILACVTAGSFCTAGDGEDLLLGSCAVCSGGPPFSEPLSLDHKDMSSDAYLVLENIIKTPEFEASGKPRIQAMLTIKSFAMHGKSSALLDLETSFLGQWCLRSSRSSLRGLRIAAGRTLPAFLSEAAGPEVDTNNRKNVINFLLELSDKCPQHLIETCILAWGQVGRVAQEHELNLVILQLVEHFGSSSQLISGVAFNEILLLAEHRRVSVSQMVRPFWSSVALVAIKDVQSRPQTAQLMADALAISVAELLVQTQTFTVPWLILSRRKETIIKIAHARGDENPGDPYVLCMQLSNVGPIFAFLLVQNVPDLDNFIMDLMRDVSPKFKDYDLLDLLRMNPIQIAIELLKKSSEEDESRKSRVRYGLQFLAGKVTTSASESQAGKRGNAIGAFFEMYILGIMTQFSEILNDMRGWQSSTEKRRALRGVEELLRVGKSHVRSALPQICSCLQSAMSNQELQSSAFSAWTTMIRSLDDEEISSMMENTFSTITLLWEQFDSSTREHAETLLAFLISKRKHILQQNIMVLPSLSMIAELSVQNEELRRMRKEIDVRQEFQLYSQRIGHEHSSVVVRALNELAEYLEGHQAFLQASTISEQPDPVVGKLVRSILDACVKFSGSHVDIARSSAVCVGLIGCLDSNRVEAVLERRDFVVVSNFEESGDTTDFVLFILEEVLVKAFLSATNSKAQGFLSYAMQELLEKCDFKAVCSIIRKPGDHSDIEPIYRKWLQLPEGVRATLSPFLKSRYVVTEMVKADVQYPIYKSDQTYGNWLRSFVLDLLEQGYNVNAMLIFAPLCRVVRIQDTSVASSLFPYAALHAVVLGPEERWLSIRDEILVVLGHKVPPNEHQEFTNVKLCSEDIFRLLDYMSRWAQEKQIQINRRKAQDSRSGFKETSSSNDEDGVQRVNRLLASIPPEMISDRAVECKSYARALFHWEQHIRQIKAKARVAKSAADRNSLMEQETPMLERLQDIYAQIDEPDGIEGISAHLSLDIDQQILGHVKNGRWAAAQSWYEIKVAQDPLEVANQINLLDCLKGSGQYDVLLNYMQGMKQTQSSTARILPLVAEASWTTGRWDILEERLSIVPDEVGGDFNVNVGRLLLLIKHAKIPQFYDMVQTIQEQLAVSLSTATTASLGSCHETMLKLHVLSELNKMVKYNGQSIRTQEMVESFERRLASMGAYLTDKQYVLGIRRAAMQLMPNIFDKGHIASAWLTSAKLARKENSMHQSYNAVLHASQLGDPSATIEHARLLWKGGNSRQAIESLKSAIKSNAFITYNQMSLNSTTFTAEDVAEQQNLLSARARLLLAKWLDNAGQTNAAALRSRYQDAAKMHQAWEKGHYYLGRHYNKLLDAEKGLPPEHQTVPYLTGETAKLVVENYLRSLNYGTKYIYQTLPRVLTLWLDLGIQVNKPFDAKSGGKEWADTMFEKRKEQLKLLHAKVAKYMQKMPAYIFYTALPQIVARIAHPNGDVYKFIQAIIQKVVLAHPQQALWTLFAVSTSTQQDRKLRGAAILQSLRSVQKKAEGGNDLRSMIRSGEKLASELLMVCNAGDFQGSRTITASITRDLGFNHKLCTPNPLVVPVEATLTASLPTLTDNIRAHKAFSRDIVTVSSFADEVLILSSLQKPRKLTARGSDGKLYGLMCKPKDDLRKDQRLMEFNSMINRSLKRDAESSKRQLYIKTYAVTPLNEECGLIEWVDGLKTLRDILLGLYKAQGVTPNYGEIKIYLDEACRDPSKMSFFTKKVLGQFPPVFHQWFVQQFPDPSAWFTARLKYTRSCAVMSMVGTILGLGDRHGENILFEEGNGGTFHVDFNCLFDKGLTFAQPERVPFRLTHNMVDAMGVYGFDGPFRKSSELTLTLLRQHEETLMTILEAFVYDPTLDLLAKKHKVRKDRERGEGMPPDTAQGVLDAIGRKVRGLLAGESVPLSVEGQVDELIKQAVDDHNLASMYIGWCAFF